MSNPSFMSMAEKIGQEIMKDPTVAPMMGMMQDPTLQAKMQERMESLKDDPVLGPVVKDMQEGGYAGMMKHWSDPNVLAKFSKAMEDIMPDIHKQMGINPDALPEGEEGDEEEEAPMPALHEATTSGDVAEVKRLLTEKGLKTDVNEKDGEGRTALHFACGYGEGEIASFLLEKGADVNAVDESNNTALHFAAGYGQKEMTELLLKKGVDRKVKNADGMTAYKVSVINGQKDISDLLAADKEDDDEDETKEEKK